MFISRICQWWIIDLNDDLLHWQAPSLMLTNPPYKPFLVKRLIKAMLRAKMTSLFLYFRLCRCRVYSGQIGARSAVNHQYWLCLAIGNFQLRHLRCWLSSLASCSLQDNLPISKTKKRASYKYTEYKNSCRLYTTSGRLTNGSLGITSTSPHWRQLPLWALR